MIVYLDQNKWIELAKIYHGKNSDRRSKEILKEFNAALDSGVIFPLSAIHYMEFARISNAERRARLGKVMLKYSQGKTIASYTQIVRHEVEVSLGKIFTNIVPSNLNLIGVGAEHAFGESYSDGVPRFINEIFEKSALQGDSRLGVEPIKFGDNSHGENFLSHLKFVQQNKHEIPRSKWENYLYAIALKDIASHIKDICIANGIDSNAFENLTEPQYKSLVNAMPTRRLDMHLHRQIIKNDNFKLSKTDLEDWAGVGVASCYCNVVVCENHFADTLKRDKYPTHARVETNLYGTFETLHLA